LGRKTPIWSNPLVKMANKTNAANGWIRDLRDSENPGKKAKYPGENQ